VYPDHVHGLTRGQAVKIATSITQRSHSSLLAGFFEDDQVEIGDDDCLGVRVSRAGDGVGREGKVAGARIAAWPWLIRKLSTCGRFPTLPANIVDTQFSTARAWAV